MMTPRDRYLSALSVEEPDRVPVFDIEILPELIKRVLSVDQQILGDLTDRPEESLRLFIKAYMKIGMDALPAYYTYLDSPEVSTKEGHCILTQRGLSQYEVAASPKGTSLKGGAFKVVGQVETMEGFNRVCGNLPKTSPDAQLKVIQEETKGLDIPTCGIIFGGYLMACILMGLEEIMKAPYQKPRLLKKMVDYMSDWQTEIGLEMIDAGADSIMIGEDFADTHNIFMSPRHFREFILPALKKQTQALKKKGVPVVLHHCGNFAIILEDIVDETGCDCLQPLQPEALDIAEVKCRVGDRVCLWGNIAINTLSLGTPEDVAREVRERIKACAPGGGYIVGSSHSLLDSVKLENLQTMIKATHKYGRYT